jgi:hypothetical protein
MFTPQDESCGIISDFESRGFQPAVQVLVSSKFAALAAGLLPQS